MLVLDKCAAGRGRRLRRPDHDPGSHVLSRTRVATLLLFGRGSGRIVSPAQRERPPAAGRRVRVRAHRTPAPCLKPCLPSPSAPRAPASPPYGHFGSFTPPPLPPQLRRAMGHGGGGAFQLCHEGTRHVRYTHSNRQIV